MLMTLHTVPSRAVPAAARRALPVLALLLLPLLLGGCGAMEAGKREESLGLTARFYVQSLRWGDYGKGLALLRHRDGSEPKVDLAALKDLQVVNTTFALAPVAGKQDEAVMTAVFHYYFEDSAAVRAVQQKATWWYDDSAGRWYLDAGLPDFHR